MFIIQIIVEPTNDDKDTKKLCREYPSPFLN